MGKRKALEPQITDWLFSCPATMPTERVAALLQVTGQPITELSAQHWREAWQVGNDMLRAYGYPERYFYHPGQKVGWGSISDWMFVKCWGEEKGPDTKTDRNTNKKFLGELILIRESRNEVVVQLAFLVDSVQAYIQHVQRMRPPATGRLIVVLAGWTDSVLAARIGGHRVAWVVNPLT